MTLCNSRKLEQAQNRQRKKHELRDCQSPSPSSSDNYCQPAPATVKQLRSSLGVIHEKTQCVWCCKAELVKHPEPKLLLIPYDHAWEAFKSHTVALQDQQMRDRINCQIDSAAEQPYALEMRYHLKCWLKYVRSYQKMSEDDKLPRMHDVTLREAQTMFFDHV